MLWRRDALLPSSCFRAPLSWGVGGSGVTGTVPSSNPLTNHDTNTLFMVALGYESTFLPQIVAGLKEIRAKHVQGNPDREIPLKVFLQPCEIII